MDIADMRLVCAGDNSRIGFGILLAVMLFLNSACQPISQDLATLPPVNETRSQVPSTSTMPVTVPLEPTMTPLASPTPVPEPTTLPSTLSYDERRPLIVELLDTNAGCRLPCWWGIDPARTSWSEAEQFILNMGASTSIFSEDDGLVYYSTGGFNFDDLQIYHEIAFFERLGAVDSIFVSASGFGDVEAFQTMWHEFGPEHIVSAYGEPSRVWIQSVASAHEGSLGDTVPYDVWLFYDDLGFLLRYDGVAKNQSTYELCPTFGVGGNLSAGLEIYMQSAKNPTPLEHLVGDRMGDSSTILSLSGATNLSIHEFSDLLQNEVVPCFETQQDLWPN
jgi:hypothetical protein